jgi:hypothetical protein
MTGWVHEPCERPGCAARAAGTIVGGRYCAGMTFAPPTGDFQPPIRGGVPYQADGPPGVICAGWVLRLRVLAGQLRRREDRHAMDAIGALIANLHQFLGHDKAALVLGVPPGDKDACIICAYERNPTEDGRAKVIAALAPPAGSGRAGA